MSPYMRRNGGPTSGQGLADPEYVDLHFVVDQQVWRYQIATTFVQNLDAIEQMQSAGRRRVDGVQGIETLVDGRVGACASGDGRDLPT